jgi:radical SAM superfamily enzyme YgiQ (UPF0313 family)
MDAMIELADNHTKRRRLLRVVIPAFPAFNVYSWVARITTALGPVSVATAVNEIEGWDVEVIDENNYRRPGPKDPEGWPDHEALQRLRPADVAGFYGGLTSTIPRLYELARCYHGLGVPTIAGGQHFIDENINEALDNGVDIIVIGEGEETIKDLLGFFSGKRGKEGIAGIAYRDGHGVVRTKERAPLTDFDQLPIADFSLLRYAKIKIYPVGRIRGCGMECEFCTVKGKARPARPERLIEQIASSFEKYRAKRFFIVDDLFGQDRPETLRFLRLLHEYQHKIKTRFKIVVQIRLDKAKDAELLLAMREAGIRNVAIGFESPIPEELKAMNKHLNPEDMISLSRVYHRAGFWIHGMFIFGYPLAEGVQFRMMAKERIQYFRKFIQKAKIDSVQALLPVPLPGTGLTRRLSQQNRIFPKRTLGWEYYDGNFPLFVPDEPMTPEEMQASILQIMGRFYRFKYLFKVGLQILSFPMLLFYLHNLRTGWSVWYRMWDRNIKRFGGWIIVRKWYLEFKKNNFPGKLEEAKRLIGHSSPGS